MTAHSALGPVQSAIYGALTANTDFMTLARAVYDDVPESAPYPYVTFGEGTENAWDTFGGVGADAVITLDTWSTYRGFKEAQAINQAMIALLDNATGLTAPGFALVVLNYEGSTQLRDPDGTTRHIATRFHVLADAT